MKSPVAIIGAGVSGLTTAVLFAERGYEVAIFADETGPKTTSAAAGAIWFPYDAEPADKVIPWALETYKILAELAKNRPSTPGKLDRLNRSSFTTGVSMIELRQFSRDREIEIPDWAHSLGAFVIPSGNVTLHPIASGEAAKSKACPERAERVEWEGSFTAFRSGFSLNVPLSDTTIYLDYLRDRLTSAGGAVHGGVHFETLDQVEPKFGLVINCAGFGAKKLVNDRDLEPHRGQVAIVPKVDGLKCAIVCDDQPLMYAIPRTNDCVFGGTNEVNDDRKIDPASTSQIVGECCRVLNITGPKILDQRVGLRPFRKSGVRLERGKLRDGRTVIHNYGHGGAGFTLSWGCAQEVLELIKRDALGAVASA